MGYASSSDVNLWIPAIDTSALVANGVVIADLINTLLPLAKSEMDDFMDQDMEEHSRTVRTTGTYVDALNLPNFPIKTVSSLKVTCLSDGSSYEFQEICHAPSEMLGLAGDANVDAADLIVDRDTGIVHVNQKNLVYQAGGIPNVPYISFNGGPLNVEATYICGFDASHIPTSLKTAHAMLVAVMVAEMAANAASGGAIAYRIGSVSRQYGAAGEAGTLVKSWWTRINDAVGRWKADPLAIGSFRAL